MADDQIEYEEELSREDLAIHEAGHAIAFLLAGCPFHSVTIEEEVTEHGILDGSIIPDPKRAERFSKQNPPMAAIMYFVNACAADVAVAKSRGKETTPFIMRDAEDESGDDASKLFTMARAYKLTIEKAGEYSIGIAFELFSLTSVWDAVERIRDMLLERVTVPYSDIAKSFYATVSKKDLKLARDYLAKWGNDLYARAERLQYVQARRLG